MIASEDPRHPETKHIMCPSCSSYFYNPGRITAWLGKLDELTPEQQGRSEELKIALEKEKKTSSI
jgi:hypothetical protein